MRLVIQPRDRSLFSVIAHDTYEQYDTASAAVLNRRNGFVHRQGLFEQCIRASVTTACDGGQYGNLVASSHDVAIGMQFVIDRQAHARQIRCEPWMSCAKQCSQFSERYRHVRQWHAFVCTAREFTRSCKVFNLNFRPFLRHSPALLS
jgi:hypothetical protein